MTTPQEHKEILPGRRVVTCFLSSDGEILILRRSAKVGSYRGRWAGVSGYIEQTPDEQAYTEIEEETGLSRKDVMLVKKGMSLEAQDTGLGVRWIVHPYLFHIEDRSKIRIDWEHREMRWIKPEELDNYAMVPRLKETLTQVYPA